MVWCFRGNRCLVDLEKHLEESVLSKLPNNYQSIFKQSMISEENDMGTHIFYNMTLSFFLFSRISGFSLVHMCMIFSVLSTPFSIKYLSHDLKSVLNILPVVWSMLTFFLL